MKNKELNRLSIEKLEELIITQKNTINLEETASELQSKLRSYYVNLANKKFSIPAKKKKKGFWN